MGRLPILSQNPTNAVIATGHSKGTVSMWTPNVKEEPVLKILAHRQPLTSLTFERSGTYMATAVWIGHFGYGIFETLINV